MQQKYQTNFLILLGPFVLQNIYTKTLDKNQSGSRRLELRSYENLTDEQSDLEETLPP